MAEEDLPDQLPAAAHADLVEDGRQVLLDGVGRDRQRPAIWRVERPRNTSAATTMGRTCALRRAAFYIDS
jgi:hypothetical protein